MNRRIEVLAVICLIGCGSGAPLNPAFAKRWTGVTTISGDGIQPISRPGALTITVDGENATVSEICPDDSGSVAVKGSGNSATWSGDFQCPKLPIAGCPDARLEYTSAIMSITQDGLDLSVAGNGRLSGCGIAIGIRNAFSGI